MPCETFTPAEHPLAPTAVVSLGFLLSALSLILCARTGPDSGRKGNITAVLAARWKGLPPQDCPALDVGDSPLFWRAACPLRSGSQPLCMGGGQPRSPIPGAPRRACPALALLHGCGCCGRSAAGGILSAAAPADPSPCPWFVSLPLVTLFP